MTIPKNTKEARQSEFCKEFREAERIEMETIFQKQIVVEEDKTDDRQLGVRFVYDIKADAEGNIVRFKCRLVCQGFDMIATLHYDETYAPVAKPATIKWLLSYTVNKFQDDHFLLCLDFKGAFLNAIVQDKYHIVIGNPPGWKVAMNKQLRLVRALYGCKNSGYLWSKELDTLLLQIGFTR